MIGENKLAERIIGSVAILIVISVIILLIAGGEKDKDETQPQQQAVEEVGVQNLETSSKVTENSTNISLTLMQKESEGKFSYSEEEEKYESSSYEDNERFLEEYLARHVERTMGISKLLPAPIELESTPEPEPVPVQEPEQAPEPEPETALEPEPMPEPEIEPEQTLPIQEAIPIDETASEIPVQEEHIEEQVLEPEPMLEPEPEQEATPIEEPVSEPEPESESEPEPESKPEQTFEVVPELVTENEPEPEPEPESQRTPLEEAIYQLSLINNSSTTEERDRAAMSYFIASGATDACGAGIMASGHVESQLGTTAYSGYYTGLFQWSPTWWKENKAWAESIGLDPWSFEAQVRMVFESGSYGCLTNFNKFKSITSARAAAEYFAIYYEGCEWSGGDQAEYYSSKRYSALNLRKSEAEQVLAVYYGAAYTGQKPYIGG